MTVFVNGKVSNNLTKKTDTVVVTGTKADNVYGTLVSPLQSPYSTFTPGDSISGNGKTVLNLSVADWVGSFTVPGATMSGVKTLNVTNLVNPGAMSEVTVDASQWGTDFKKFNVSGAQNLSLHVDNLKVANGALVATAKGNDQAVFIDDAKMGASTVTLNLYNSTSDETSSKAVANGNRLLAKAGEGDFASVRHFTTGATVAGVSLDNVTAVSDNWFAGVDFWLEAEATAGAATVGDVTLNKVALQGGNTDVWIESSAISITSGNATTGDMSITDVTLAGSSAADINLLVENKADATAGNASVGSVKIASIDVALASGGGEGINSVNLAQIATAVTGNATIADASVSGFKAVIGSGQDLDFGISQVAVTTTGNASLGLLTIGDVSIAATGDGTAADQDDFNVSRSATTNTGNASIGATAIGAINVVNDFHLTVAAAAEVTSGAYAGIATVGDIAIGAVTAVGNGDEVFEMDVNASTVGGAWSDNNSIGKFTSGAVSSVTAAGNSGYELLIAANNGKAGAVNAGNVTLASSTGNASINVDVRADNGLDTVTVGNLSAIGAGSSLGVNIGSGTIGNVTLGNLSTSSKTNTNFGVTVDPGTGTVGNVTIGNVSADVKSSGTFDGDAAIKVGSGAFSGAVTKQVGNVTIGNISLAGAAASVVGDFEVDVIGTTLGNTQVGNVSVTAATLVDAKIDMSVAADTAIGNVSIGTIGVTSGASTSKAGFNLEASGRAAGVDTNVTTGAISVAATGAHPAGAGTQGSEVVLLADGRVAVGNITATVSGGASGNVSEVLVSAKSSGTGTITAGSISVTATGSSTAIDNADATVQLGDATNASVTTGGITMTAAGNGADSVVTLVSATGGIKVSGSTSLSASNAVTSGSATNTLNLTTTGAIEMGNISGSSVAIASSVAVDNQINLGSTASSITLGNITVIGDAATDGMEALGINANSWVLGTTAGAIKVGNIDYGSYVGAATIDLFGDTVATQWTGASFIKAGAGGADITGNTTVNTYTLDSGAAGVDTIRYFATTTGAGAHQANWTASANDAGLAGNADYIINFRGGTDEINVETTNSSGSAPATTQVFDGGTDATYAAFLADANAEIGTTVSSNQVNVYFAKVTESGTNTYWVAVDANTDNTIDYVVKVDAIGTIVAADIA